MKKTDLQKIKLPDTPGVYFFLGKRSEILYIGKATSLKSRVSSYFAPDIKDKRSKLIENMVQEAKTVDFTETDSVLEAIILEVNLIRTHKPKYNTKSKDDKSYNHIVITKEKWPRVLLVREKDLTEKLSLHEIDCEFGPFPSALLLRDALRVIKRLFKYYDGKTPLSKLSSKISRGEIEFNRQINLYPETSDYANYKKTIRHLKLFLSGKKNIIIKEMEKEMMRLSKEFEFEKANVLKKKIFALKHISDVSLLKRNVEQIKVNNNFRIEAYDVAHLAGQNMVGVMVVVCGSEPQNDQYRRFKINILKKANDPGALGQIFQRRLEHSDWPTPDLIVVDGNEVQMNSVLKILQSKKLNIPVIAVTKNKQHKAEKLLGDAKFIHKYKLEILLANSEAHRFAINYYRKKQRQNIFL